MSREVITESNYWPLWLIKIPMQDAKRSVAEEKVAFFWKTIGKDLDGCNPAGSFDKIECYYTKKWIVTALYGNQP